MSINPYISAHLLGSDEWHPGLRIVIAESGIGWIPYFLERMESVCDKQAKSLGTTLERRPAEIFRSQFYATSKRISGIALRHSIGVGQISGQLTTHTARRPGPTRWKPPKRHSPTCPRRKREKSWRTTAERSTKSRRHDHLPR